MTRAASSQAERLTRIETLLETAVTTKIDEMASDIKAIREEMTTGFKDVRKELGDDKADLASLKNKGTGLLIGAAIAGGAGWEAVKAIVGSVLK